MAVPVEIKGGLYLPALRRDDGLATDVKITLARRPDIVLPPHIPRPDRLPNPSEYINTEGFFTEPNIKVGKNVILLAGQRNAHEKLNLSANTYFFGRTIVDPGSEEGIPQLIRNLKQLRMDLGDIEQILITHLHDDHAEALQRMQAEGFNGKVYASAESKVYNELADDKHAVSDLFGRPYKPFLIHDTLAQGDMLPDGEFRLDVHDGPGHTDDHKWFLVTDSSGHKSALIGDIFMGGYGEEFNSDPFAWVETIAAIIANEPDEIFAGHMDPSHLPQHVTPHLVKELLSFGRQWRPLFPSLPHTMLNGW